MTAVLKITDGTYTVNLLSPSEIGFHLAAWEPTIADYKGGGVFRDSPLATGRRIVGKYFANTIETMTLSLRGDTDDDAAYRLQQLRQLLEKASSYWVAKFATEPVWVEARSPKETNTRYAILHTGRVGNDQNYYAAPFLQPGCEANLNDLQLTFERGHWQSSPPGTRECAAPSVPLRKAFVPTEGGDDAFIVDDINFIQTSATYIRVGNIGVPTQDVHCGVRFKNVTIPKNAKILSAHLCFEGAITDTTATVNAKIYGELNVTPAIFSTYADFNARTLTEGFALWSAIPSETDGMDIITPDLARIVQEIVDLPTWASGKNLVIILRDNASSNTALRYFAAYEDTTHHEPILVVTWMDAAEACDSVDYPVEFIVVNKRNRAQLTGFYFYDLSLTTFSDNFLNGNTYPYVLDNGPDVAVGDIFYFQAGPPSTYSGPFNNVVFDFGQDENAMSLTFAWEYWNGAWAALGVTDYTLGMSELGKRSIHWQPPSGWIKFDLGSLGGTNNPDAEGYTIRGRVTAVGDPGPATLVSHPYTVLWPYVEIPAASVISDLTPLAELEVRSCKTGGGADLDWLMFGLRSVSRGNDFDAYLNASDEQHPYGVAVTAGTNTTFVAATSSATGIVARCSFATPAMNTRFTWTFSEPLADQYVGRFRAFLLTNTAPSGITAFLRVTVTEATFDLETVALTVSEQITDLGVLDMSSLESGDPIASLVIALRMAGGTSTDIRGLVLMPTDEYSAEIGDTGNLVDTDYYLDVDSVRFPKSILRAVGRAVADDVFARNFRAIALPPAVFQANARQRVFFLTKESGNLHEAADAVAVAPYKLSQFFSLRGRR